MPNGAGWSVIQDELLRRHYADKPTALLASLTGRSVAAVKSRAKRLGLLQRGRRRLWTPAEVETLRQLHPDHECQEIAARLGRSLKSVYLHAHELGLTKSRRNPPALITAARQLFARGLCDAEIAQELAIGYDQAKHLRSTYCSRKCNQDREAKRRSIENQRRTLGVASGGELRALGYRNYARDNGWPESLRPREVQILNLLSARGVPMTKRELAAAMGMRTDRIGGNGRPVFLAGNGRGGTYTASLVRQGLLQRLKRMSTVLGQGKGRSLDLYTLGPAALAILQERAQCEIQTATAN